MDTEPQNHHPIKYRDAADSFVGLRLQEILEYIDNVYKLYN